jgi:hypothetical protein
LIVIDRATAVAGFLALWLGVFGLLQLGLLGRMWNAICRGFNALVGAIEELEK